MLLVILKNGLSMTEGLTLTTSLLMYYRNKKKCGKLTEALLIRVTIEEIFTISTC